MTVVSIQFAATRINGSGAEVVPRNSDSRTHFSVYIRDETGKVEWVVDFSRDSYIPALVRAAELSMKYNAPIEQIK